MSSQLVPAAPLAAPPSSVFQRWGRGGTGIVLGLAALVMLLIGGTIGLALGSPSTSSSAALTIPAADSVDVGFVRDMSVHHEQGVLLAHLVQGEGSNSEVNGIAYDIEYQQTSQIGQMGGFLQLWGYPLQSLSQPMAWMTSAGHDMAGMADMSVDPARAADGAIMPGMATTTEVNKLKTLTGDAADSYFLQLMIRHHEGGVPMMQYAAQYATNAVVKNMAEKMVQSQVAEITSMTQLLKSSFGADPLPAPADYSGGTGTAAGTGGSAGGTGTTVTLPTSDPNGMTGMTGATGMSGMSAAPTTS